jgi:hypothetical protein
MGAQQQVGGTREIRPRRDRRMKIFQPATLTLSRGALPAHLLDVSLSGVRAHCGSPLALGDTLVLLCNSVRRLATVVWVRDEQSGIRFLLPLDQSELEALLV